MKKLLLFCLLVTLASQQKTLAQGSCPKIDSSYFTSLGGGVFTITVKYTAASVNATVRIRGFNAGDTLCYNQCLTVISGTNTFTSPPFTCTLTRLEIKTYLGLNCSSLCTFTLPVKMKSFEVNRSAANVNLVWITALEQNNKGFAIERNINGSWQQVAFVSSKAPNGNSSSDLSYTYKDANNSKSVTQYRIKQLDLDGQFQYSDVKIAKGTDQTAGGINVYPNPSTGKINVVLTEKNDVKIITADGRIVEQRKYTGNNMEFTLLNRGVFFVSSGGKTQKFIIQ